MKEAPPTQSEPKEEPKVKEPKVEVSMLPDSEDPKKFVPEHLASMQDRIKKRLEAVRLAAASQEPKPEPVADPAVVSGAPMVSSPDATEPTAVAVPVVNEKKDKKPAASKAAKPSKVLAPRSRGKGGRGKGVAEDNTSVPAVEAAAIPPVLVENKQESLMNVTQEIPAGQHWIVEDALGSTFTVRSGAKLTISDALSTTVTVEKGGEATISGASVGSKIVHVDSIPPASPLDSTPVASPDTTVSSAGSVDSGPTPVSGDPAPLGAPVAAAPSIDIPVDVKIADAAARKIRMLQLDQLLSQPGIDDATKAELEAFKKSDISDAELAALQEKIQSLAIPASAPDVVATVQPRRRRVVNKPSDAVLAALAAAGTAPDAPVPAAASGGIPTGIDPVTPPVLVNPLPDDFDKKYNIEGMTLAPKDSDSLSSAPETVVPPETLVSPEAPKVETSEAEAMSEIERLKVMVGEARLQYVTTDYNQDSWWKKFKNVLGAKNLGDRNDVDTQAAFDMYNHALTEYQNAQLTEMEKEGLTPEERSKRMAGMLKFLKADEFLEMKKARHQVKLEGMTKAEKVVEAFEKVGQWYNKLPKKAKFAVSAAIFAGVAGTAMVGSPTLIAGAAGLSLCKRLVATAGLAVSANNLIEGWQEKKMKNRAESDTEEDLSIIFAKDKGVAPDWETQVAQLQKILEKDRNALYTRFGKLPNQERLRRLGALGGATALVFGASVVSAATSGSGITDEARARAELATHGSGGAVSAAAASSAPESASAAARAASSVAGAASGVPESSVAGGVINELPNATNQHLFENETEGNRLPNALNQHLFQESSTVPSGVAAEAVPVSENAASLLKEHVVTSADGKRGLWGILDKRLDGIPKGPGRDRMIQSLENIIAKRDIADLKKFGFPTGDINKIYPGTIIDFSKLLTPQEIQSVLDGQSVGAPRVTSVVDAVSAEKVVKTAASVVDTNSAEYQASLRAAEDQMIAQDRVEHGYTPAEQAALNRAEDEMIADERAKEKLELSKATKIGTLDAAKEAFNLSSLNTPQAFASFYAEHPTEMRRTFVRIGSDVFRTPEVLSEARNHFDVSPYSYNQATLGKVQMSWVHQTFGEMRVGATRFVPNTMRFPLHPSQMENLVNLTAVAQDPNMFGAAGRPLYNETVNDYMSRMSAYAVATGKSEVLTRALHRRY